MLPRRFSQTGLRRAPGDVALTERARHHGDADTPVPAARPLAPERSPAVASVAVVTRAAHVASPTTPSSPELSPERPAAPVPAGRTAVRPRPADARPGPPGRRGETDASGLPPVPPPARAPVPVPAVVGKREVKRQ